MIVLDTHVLIWFFQGDTRMGDRTRERIEEAAIETNIFVPAIYAWEIGLIEKRDVLPFSEDSVAWLQRVLSLPGFTLVPLEPAIAIGSVRLNWPHRDPADRMIVATASHLRAPLLTADAMILRYAAAGHVEAIDARA